MIIAITLIVWVSVVAINCVIFVAKNRESAVETMARKAEQLLRLVGTFKVEEIAK